MGGPISGEENQKEVKQMIAGSAAFSPPATLVDWHWCAGSKHIPQSLITLPLVQLLNVSSAHCAPSLTPHHRRTCYPSAQAPPEPEEETTVATSLTVLPGTSMPTTAVGCCQASSGCSISHHIMPVMPMVTSLGPPSPSSPLAQGIGAAPQIPLHQLSCSDRAPA